MSTWERWNTHWSTEVEVEVMDFPFRLKQDPNSNHLGTTVWDASIVLAKYLEKCNNQNNGDPSLRRLRGKTVLELGSGMGLGGMVCALKGANVILTDQKEVLPLLNSNVGQNLAPGVLKGLEWDLKSVGNIEVCELDWLKPEQRQRYAVNNAKNRVGDSSSDDEVKNLDQNNVQQFSTKDNQTCYNQDKNDCANVSIECNVNATTSSNSHDTCKNEISTNIDSNISCTFADEQNCFNSTMNIENDNNIIRNFSGDKNYTQTDNLEIKSQNLVHENCFADGKFGGKAGGQKCSGSKCKNKNSNNSKSGNNCGVDLILCADCVYNESLIEYLLDTVLEICGNKTTVLVVNEDRSDSVKQKFEDLFGGYFTMKKIPHSKMDPVYQHPKIDIFLLKKRKES
eukprot:TRINITY_DN8991_c0_g2_i1.p1 TRINITY_DN8991_c0_g2~~TRINITY_DN8991_c0_g2_i1.p1  ORF type:complete len:397 (+),score=44.51 TRINITY_DN8991_c0_g2_i1:91-1281(+)